MDEKQSGQMSDPGREKQIANHQDPSGQTGSQTGRVEGKQVQSGVPQGGGEPNSQVIDKEEDLKRFKPEEDNARKR